MKNNSEYHYLLDDIAHLNKQREENILPLNEKTAKEKQVEREKNNHDRMNERRVARGLKPLKEGETQPAEDIEKYDLILDETLLIATDMLK